MEIEGSRALIKVRDSGVGIEPHVASKLFEVFGQAVRSIERAPGSLGLGLASVDRLTEMHGGSMPVKCEGAARGSTFSVNLLLMQHVPDSAYRDRPTVGPCRRAVARAVGRRQCRHGGGSPHAAGHHWI